MRYDIREAVLELSKEAQIGIEEIAGLAVMFQPEDITRCEEISDMAKQAISKVFDIETIKSFDGMFVSRDYLLLMALSSEVIKLTFTSSHRVEDSESQQIIDFDTVELLLRDQYVCSLASCVAHAWEDIKE